jgi:hypothetical protein
VPVVVVPPAPPVADVVPVVDVVLVADAPPAPEVPPDVVPLVVATLVVLVVAVDPAVPPLVDVVVAAFTQRPCEHVSPLSHAPPDVHAHPSAPKAQSVADEDEQATHENAMAIAAKVPSKTCLPYIASSFVSWSPERPARTLPHRRSREGCVSDRARRRSSRRTW